MLDKFYGLQSVDCMLTREANLDMETANSSSTIVFRDDSTTGGRCTNIWIGHTWDNPKVHHFD